MRRARAITAIDSHAGFGRIVVHALRIANDFGAARSGGAPRGRTGRDSPDLAATHRSPGGERAPGELVRLYGAGLGCCSCSASMRASTSGDSFTSTLAMFSLSCAIVVAPIRLLVVNGRLFTNASANCAGV